MATPSITKTVDLQKTKRRQPMSNITVFSKNQCVKCNMTKKFLENNNIPFTEINIDNPEHLNQYGKTRDEVISHIKDNLNLSTMPVVVTEYDVWGDYRLDKLRSLVSK